MISHIVLFEPKPGLNAVQKKAFAQQLQAVCRTIPSIRRATVGKAVAVNPGYSRSMGQKTYAYSAVIEFDSQDGLLEYLRDPAHHALGRLFWDLCESTVVVECECADARTDDIADLLVG